MWLRKAFLNEERSFSLLANTGAAANQTSSSAKHFLAHDRDLFFVGWLFFLTKRSAILQACPTGLQTDCSKRKTDNI